MSPWKGDIKSIVELIVNLIAYLLNNHDKVKKWSIMWEIVIDWVIPLGISIIICLFVIWFFVKVLDTILEFKKKWFK